MKTYIALLRGINVGSTRSLPMKELVAVLEELGCRNIKTYIQSGNVVFHSEEGDAAQLSNRISSEIMKRRGFEPYVLLLGLEEFKSVVAGNPFPEAESDPQSLHVGFLAAAPDNPDLDALESLKVESERFLLTGTVFYLHAPEGIGRSKLAASAEKLLGVALTDRNMRTVRKIEAMLNEISNPEQD